MTLSTSTYIKPILVATAVTAICTGVGLYVWREQHREPVLEIYVFALKSGRSMLIRTPDDQRILVDGGGTSQVVQRLTDIIPFHSRRIDTIIVTNTDGRNVSGLIDVISRYDVGKVYVPRFTLENTDSSSSTDRTYATLFEVLGQLNITPITVTAMDRLPIGADTSMNILFPVSPSQFDYSKTSAPEVLFTISYKHNSVLFMGDASRKVQKYIASSSRESIIDTDVLIVSHAAAATNMSDELMNIARPGSLIFEKTVANASSDKTRTVPKSSAQKSMSSKVGALKKKTASNPLAAILEDSRFNLKKVGTVKIVASEKGMIVNAVGQ